MDAQVVHDAVHGLVLQDVGEDLRVEAAAAVAPGNGGVCAQLAGEFIQGRHFGQQLDVVVDLPAFVGDLESFLGGHVGVELVVQAGQAVVVHGGAFVVQAQAGGQDPGAGAVHGFVKEGGVPEAQEEVRIDGHGLVGDVQVADVVGDVLVGVVQDEALDAFLLEGDGCREVVETVEGEKARGGLPGGFLIGLSQEEFCGGGAAQLFLPQGEDGAGGVVLVHVHVVGQSLQGGGGFQGVFLAGPDGSEAFQQGQALVAAFVVVGDGVLDAVFVQAVGEASFLGQAQAEGVGQCAVAIFPFPVGLEAVVGVAEAAFGGVEVVAVAVTEAGREGVPPVGERAAGAQGVGGAVFRVEGGRGVFGGGEGLQDQHAAHGVATVKGALRSS